MGLLEEVNEVTSWDSPGTSLQCPCTDQHSSRLLDTGASFFISDRLNRHLMFIVFTYVFTYVFTIHLTRWKGPSNYEILVASSITVRFFFACPVQYTQTGLIICDNQMSHFASGSQSSRFTLPFLQKIQPLQLSMVNYSPNKIEKQHYQLKQQWIYCNIVWIGRCVLLYTIDG